MRFAFLILLSLSPSLIAAPALPPDNRATVEALRQAAEFLETADIDPDELAGLWCKVAELRHRIGDRRGAIKAIERACEIVEGVGGGPREWRPMLLACARMGETDKALELAGHFPEDGNNVPEERGFMLWRAVREAARAGRFRVAEEIADRNEHEDFWLISWQEIRSLEIVARFKKGDTEAAIRMAMALPTAWGKLWALVGTPTDQPADDITELDDSIADMQLLANDKAGARRSAMTALALIPDLGPGEKPSAVVAVIRILCLLDDIREARKVMVRYLDARPRKENYWNDELLARSHLAAAEVRAGRDEAALAFLKDFDRPEDQAFLLQVIALDQARAGRREVSTMNFARAIERAALADDRDPYLSGIIEAQALAGDFDGATWTAQYFRCGLLLEKIIFLQSKTGDFDGARMIFHTIPSDRYWIGNILPQIARMQGAAGQPAAVREWAAKLDDPRRRAAVLIGLAEGLCQSPGKPGGK
ncbi:hypothetical protein [Zavarzinella formosa]|uniref:hypothetical protein n=1 Tax=Zavarzinella formosa TaxID=360055 RepID=UPI0002E81F6C|nr:hypothetical protein [Zavarzinella formosa]